MLFRKPSLSFRLVLGAIPYYARLLLSNGLLTQNGASTSFLCGPLATLTLCYCARHGNYCFLGEPQ